MNDYRVVWRYRFKFAKRFRAWRIFLFIRMLKQRKMIIARIER